MSLKAYFFSDLHISSIEEPKTHWLLNFFQSIKSREQMTHLFLVGDIFDLWVAGHFYFLNKFKPVIEELRRLHELGIEIHYFEGNHDLYLEHFFGKVCGFQIHRGPLFYKFGELNIRIEHGDEMDPDDKGYKFLRWFLRTPVLEWLAPRLPDFIVVWIGEKMSAASRHYTSELKTISSDRARAVIRAHAERAWLSGKFDLLVTGHVHLVEDYNFSAFRGGPIARVINLGSWFDGARALKVETGEAANPSITWVELNS